MSAQWAFNMTCPRDGGTLEIIAQGRPSKQENRSVVRCKECLRRWLVVIQLAPLYSAEKKGFLHDS